MANILGINLSDISPAELRIKIGEFLAGSGQHYLVTPNPEIILKSHKDEELFYILNQADLSIADGFGLKIAGLVTGQKISRITGADVSADLLQTAREKEIKVAILNWHEGLSRHTDIEKALSEKYPGLEALVIDAPRSIDLAAEELETINRFAPKILFNTFGSPYQEKTIFHNLSKMPSVRLALGIGGSFDFITGRITRAPKFFRRLGLEWVWRLIQQPRRWKRIYRATVTFTGKLLRAETNRFFYRPNVACFLYKNTASGPKVLIVERTDQPGHWQLPQGGTDGESLEKAGARELRQELNTDKFVKKAVFKDTYSYLFPPIDWQSKIAARRVIYNYKGQRQGLFVAEFTGSDEDIRINYWDHRAWKWVEKHELLANLNPIRRAGAKIFLEKFNSLKI